MNIMSFPSLANVSRSITNETYVSHACARAHTRFLGELLDRSQSPPFLPPFLRCDRADEENKKRERERERERDRETERKIMGESWNPRLETRANKLRLRLQTSRLNVYSRVPSIVDLRTTTVKKKKNSCVQCVIVPTRVSPLPQPVSGYAWWPGIVSPCFSIQLGKTRNLGCMNEEMWDSSGSRPSLIQS